mmetsp:Transcript_16050/g.16174  ORF Transcript_16050/g.16174 Transcript_16050/m.16174 type:complete len:180 (+) Transcript_16050:80-619(+)|eukprot:CAMPEP_0182430204 /NCGR_PEP_ID=MMETSP1167-20130531/38308_1 /TAXON_ID=2988 /ORGANISM="Mallomonas Sp, Strain CCMP3275" /LENGTH=179 /DNA_ID=CAMNT_0024615053 /DNA_START=11 /DNA_END=550 /DNA_ORIENTATION=+
MTEAPPAKRYLRSGKWTVEEELYAEKLIKLFQIGCDKIDASKGQTLRCFLSAKLKCPPMRISKKFSKYYLAERFLLSTESDTIETNTAELSELEELYVNYSQKDVVVQSNRLKRRKYYEKYSHELEKSKIIKVEHHQSESESIHTPIQQSSNHMKQLDESLTSDDESIDEDFFEMFDWS